MKFSLVQDHTLGAIFLRARGRFLVDQCAEIQPVMRAFELYKDDVPILNDYSDTNPAGVAMQEIFELNHAPRPGLRKRRSALVHGDDLGFGMTRASAIRETLLGMRTEAFRTVPEAMAWLFPGQGLTELPSEVAAIHQARLGTGPVLDPEMEVFEDSIHSAPRRR